MIVRQMLTQLFPWQTRAVEKLLPLRVGALYMEQGTGKTRTAYSTDDLAAQYEAKCTL